MLLKSLGGCPTRSRFCRDSLERKVDPLMKRLLIYIACLGLILTAIPVTKAQAAVSFSLRIGERYRGPQLSFYSQPDVVLIPGTEVYTVDNADYDLYRYGDYWYYYYDGGWYRADDIDGPFYFISYTSIPYEIRYVPVSYRHHWSNWRGAMYGSYRNGYWYRSGNPGYTSYYYQRDRDRYYPTRTYYQNRDYYRNRTYQTYDQNRTSYQTRPENRQYYPSRNYIQQQNNHSRDYNQVNRREVPQHPQPQPQQQQAPPQGRGQGQGNGRGHGQGNGNGHGNGRGHNQDQCQ